MIKISTCPSAALGCSLSATRERPVGGEARLQLVQTRLLCCVCVHQPYKVYKSSTPKKVMVKGWVVWMDERMKVSKTNSDYTFSAGPGTPLPTLLLLLFSSSSSCGAPLLLLFAFRRPLADGSRTLKGPSSSKNALRYRALI